MKWYEGVVDQSKEIKYFYPKDFKANVWGNKEDFSLAIAMMTKQIQGKDKNVMLIRRTVDILEDTVYYIQFSWGAVDFIHNITIIQEK